MVTEPFKISVYMPDMRSQVLDIMSFLWKRDLQGQQEYFKWKYIDNPYTEKPLCVVAMHNGQIVGFRGYFALRFEVANTSNDTIVLVAGDTCVHPDFHRKGISVLMGYFAMDTFSDTHKILLNMTTTAPSLPGYLKLGFQPIAKKAYFSRYSISGFIRYFMAYKKQPRMEKPNISFGDFGQVIVSDRPEPGAMATICASQATSNPCIRLHKDERFFRWRFQNPFKSYIFYYFRQNAEIKGYVIIGLSPNYLRGYILDFGDTDGESAAYLLEHMILNNHFDILSIYLFSIGGEFRKKLRDLGFRSRGLVRSLERKKTGELPVLIRPAKKSYTETDWEIEGFDIREIKNWQINEICSDAV